MMTVRIVATALMAVALGGPAMAQASLDALGAQKIIDATGGEVQTGGATVVVNGTASKVRAGGASVAVHANVLGDVDALAAELTVDGPVGGGVHGAAGMVTLIGDIGGEVLIAGGKIVVTSTVGGRARIYGGQIAIGQQAAFADRVDIGGGDITFDGTAKGPARLSGGIVTVNGAFDGDVILEGGRIVLAPTAVIGGNLTIRSVDEPSIDPGARIAGTTTREAPHQWWEQASSQGWKLRLLFAAFLAVSTFVTGIVLMLIGRGTFEDAVTLARTKIVGSFLVGIVAVILLPLIAIVLIATVIGVPIGFAILLSLPVIFIVSYSIAATGLADLIFNRPFAQRIAGRTAVFLIVGAVIIGLLSLVPVAGPWLVLLLLLWGIGAWLRSVRRRGRRRAIPPVGGEKSPMAA